MRYQIKQVSLKDGMFWGIYVGRKLFRVFAEKSEAEIMCQRLVEDDAWHNANQ